jgi:hypothetical protein
VTTGGACFFLEKKDILLPRRDGMAADSGSTGDLSRRQAGRLLFPGWGNGAVSGSRPCLGLRCEFQSRKQREWSSESWTGKGLMSVFGIICLPLMWEFKY